MVEHQSLTYRKHCIHNHLLIKGKEEHWYVFWSICSCENLVQQELWSQALISISICILQEILLKHQVYHIQILVDVLIQSFEIRKWFLASGSPRNSRGPTYINNMQYHKPKRLISIFHFQQQLNLVQKNFGLASTTNQSRPLYYLV